MPTTNLALTRETEKLHTAIWMFQVYLCKWYFLSKKYAQLTNSRIEYINAYLSGP